MSEYGAMLQSYNQDLVKYIEQLKRQREQINASLENDEIQKQDLQIKIDELTQTLNKLNENIVRKTEMKNDLQKTLDEANLGLKKIIESSEVILNVVKREVKQYKYDSCETKDKVNNQ